MFRRGVDKKVCRSCCGVADCLLKGSCILTRLRNLLESSSSDNTKRYDNCLPVRELDLKDPHATNQNQLVASDLEGVQAVVPRPSAVGTDPCHASREKDKGYSAATHEVRARATADTADTSGSHQVRESVIVKDIRDAQEKISVVKSIPGPVQTTVNVFAPANTAMAQLDIINATYLQPLRAFNAVVTGLANVCLPD